MAEALDQREDGAQGVRARVCERVGPRRLREAPDHRVIFDHLQGRHVVGVYPLLIDETCWFLAADFDKASWTEDIAAVMETCRTLGLPAAVERSRSGNGAHV